MSLFNGSGLRKVQKLHYHLRTRGPVRLAQSVERCGSQSEGPGFKSRRRRWDSSVGQTANGPCLSRLSCINEYKCSYDALQSMVEPPQRPSAGAMGHHPRCFARSISSQIAGEEFMRNHKNRALLAKFFIFCIVLAMTIRI